MVIKNPNPKKRTNDNNEVVGSKNQRTGRNSFTKTNRVRRNLGGGGGDDPSDDEFFDFIVGTYHNHRRTLEDLEEEETQEDFEEVIIRKEIENIDDLIELGNLYKSGERKKYNINVKTLNKLIEPLTELKNMIGMPKLKKSILDQIIYFMQDFEEKNSHMMHTIIEGPPGSGKTEVSKILAKIYARMGFLKTEKVKSVRRSDLVGQYLGQTAIKTQKVIDGAKGGVLLIDEAYSLGNPEGRDSYSKECIDTINQNLSEGKTDFICIIVGYKDSLKESFFSYNAGLERRFPFRYSIDEYTSEDLKRIFEKLVGDMKWEINCEKKKIDKFFEDNRKIFEFNGGDLENLFQCSKITHSRRVFTLDKDVKKKLTIEDLNNGLEMMKNNEEIANRSTKDKANIIHNMYL